MKRIVILQLAAAMISIGSLPGEAVAQISSVTRPTIQGGGVSASYFGIITNRPAPATNLVWITREKTQAEKAETLRKTIDFQKKRADEGSATAQFDLGNRFLTGDGVTKNRDVALQWLRKSADQGHTQAIKKVEELQKGSALP